MSLSVGAPLNKPSQVAVIGCGNWGKNLIRVFHELGALYAIDDTNPSKANALAQQFNIPVIPLSTLLLDPNVDAIVLATPSFTHHALAQQCLDAKKHVYVEKPFTLDVHAAASLTQLAEQQSRILMVGHLLQYHPVFQALKQKVHEGLIGKLRYCRFERTNCGKFPTEKSVLWDFSPHDISMLLAITGTMPIRLHAEGGHYLSHTQIDTVSLDFEFPHNVKANIYASWLHPHKSQKAMIVGDQGMLTFDDLQPWEQKLQLHIFPPQWEDGLPTPVNIIPVPVTVSPKAEPLRQECEHFLMCIAENRQPLTNGVEATQVVQVLHSAEQSLSAVKQAQPA